MSYTEARSHFERARLNPVDKGVIDLLDGLKHSCEEITVSVYGQKRPLCCFPSSSPRG
jgi:hypothetical protein